MTISLRRTWGNTYRFVRIHFNMELTSHEVKHSITSMDVSYHHQLYTKLYVKHNYLNCFKITNSVDWRVCINWLYKYISLDSTNMVCQSFALGTRVYQYIAIYEINVDLRTSGFDNEVLSVDACAVWWKRESLYCLPRIGVVTWHREPRFQCGSARTGSIWNSSIFMFMERNNIGNELITANK